MESESLPPAAELARDNPVRIPNESAEYRAARTALLAKEIELRRHIERVAAQRRSLPPGGPVIGDYRFEGEDGKVIESREVGALMAAMARRSVDRPTVLLSGGETTVTLAGAE